MILCIGPTPAVQRVMVFPRWTVDAVNRASVTLDGLGGKGLNVARVLTQLGERTLVLGFAGGTRGRWMREELGRTAVPFDFVEVPAETRLCITVMDEGRGTITELVEESAATSQEAYEELFASFKVHLPQARAVVMSGTLTPGGPVDFYARCVAEARNAGVISIVDAQGPTLMKAIEERPNVVKPNRHELEKTLGRFEAARDVWAGMDELLGRGVGAVVVTDGPSKVLACSAVGRWEITPPQVKTANPIGSGDSFTAAMAACLTAGGSLGEACRAGAAAGAANALTLMPGAIERGQYEGLIKEVKVQRAERS